MATIAAVALLSLSGGAAAWLTLHRTSTAQADALRAIAGASRASDSPRCTPTTLNRSAILPGTSLSVSPLPDSYDASPETQISILGASVSDLIDVRVSGSQSGSHPGRLLGYSQGDGGSFLARKPFISGERVTVRGAVREGSSEHSFGYQFIIAHRDLSLAPSTTKHVFHDPQEMQHFHSRPELEPPLLVVTQSSPNQGSGDLFAAAYSGPGPSGPEIFEPSGNLVWFEALPPGIEATDLQSQELNGKPVLTWWQGRIPPQGFGEGEDVIDNSSYQRIATVHAGNGFTADLHEFRITPQGTALITVFDPIYCNLSTSHGGSATDAVTDSMYQEIDLSTGLVRREWHSVDHIPLTNSYSSAYGSSAAWPFDYFHLNSIDPQADGMTLISSRNTSALYELNTTTGQVSSEIGGRHSTVTLGPGTSTAYQHDATVLADGDISLFDNGGVPKVHGESRGLIVAVNPQASTDSFQAQYELSPPLLAGSQGSMQVLEGGNVFIGWGAFPYFSEFTPSGQLLYESHWHGSYESYRTYRFPWTGAPSAPPAIAAGATSPTTPVTVYASWNGDTRTSSWRVLAGASPHALAPVAVGARTGFETAITTPGHEAYVAVQALGSGGEVLGTSKTIASR
jgi:hypothetical protein